MSEPASDRTVNKAAQVAELSGARADISFSRPAIDAMNALRDDRQVHSVADAIGRIGGAPDRKLKITAPEMPSEQYKIMIPKDDSAPVVMYRDLTLGEGGGYLVAALVPWETYENYESVDDLLGTPSGRHGLMVAQDVVRRARR